MLTEETSFCHHLNQRQNASSVNPRRKSCALSEWQTYHHRPVAPLWSSEPLSFRHSQGSSAPVRHSFGITPWTTAACLLRRDTLYDRPAEGCPQSWGHELIPRQHYLKKQGVESVITWNLWGEKRKQEQLLPASLRLMWKQAEQTMAASEQHHEGGRWHWSQKLFPAELCEIYYTAKTWYSALGNIEN